MGAVPTAADQWMTLHGARGTSRRRRRAGAGVPVTVKKRTIYNQQQHSETREWTRGFPTRPCPRHLLWTFLLLSLSLKMLGALPLALRPLVASSARLAPPVASLDFGVALYEAQLGAESLVADNLASVTPLSALVLFGAGLLTSLTPCCLSMLPVTFAYIGGLGTDEEGSSPSTWVPAVAFSSGLAVAFAALGVSAASLGSLFGSAGDGPLLLLRAAVSLLAVGLGLNLLQLLPFALPSIDVINASSMTLPPSARAFLFGASSALVASPCASPVLASILGYVATLGDPVLGAALLLCFTLGYTAPVLLTGLAASSARSLVAELEGGLEWVTPASGAVLLAYGTYNGLSTALGPALARSRRRHACL